jgi:hypothetical protein
VYWGSAASWSPRHPYDAYWKALGDNSAFYSRLREYGNISGYFNRSYDYTEGATGSLTEETLEAGIRSAIGSYVPTSGDIFVVLLPSGTISLRDQQAKFGGHHSSATFNGVTTPWAVVEYYPFSSLQVQWRSSHEVMESITDPDAHSSCSGGICSGYNGSGWTPEIGDPCNGKTTQIAGLTTQQFYSAVACRCVREEDLLNVDVYANGLFSLVVARPDAGPGGQTVWYPDTGGYFTNWNFGVSGDHPFAGDYDGDGQTEFGMFSPGSSTAAVLNIVSGVYWTATIGTTGDVIVPGDYDNPADGQTDLAVWQASLGWRFLSSATGAASTPVSWGTSGDIPVPADYDGDGTTDYAVIRPSDGTLYYLPSASPGTQFTWIWTFTTDDVFVPGDYDGDGYADYAYFRPSTGDWHVNYLPSPVNGATNYAYIWSFGEAGDVPIGRDWDGDWITDLGFWRPATGAWTVLQSSSGDTFSPRWGEKGDTPIGSVHAQ